MHTPNILLIVLDATRADACSCYGNEHETTPHLDRLAEEGTLFEQAISTAPWTLPAMASIFTGLYPGQIDIYKHRELSREYPVLPELLSQNGYATFGISNNSWLSTDFGLTRGFQRMHKLWQWVQADDDLTLVNLTQYAPGMSLFRAALHRVMQGNIIKNFVNLAYHRFWNNHTDYGAGRTLKPLSRWIERQDTPWFAFVHYLEAHLQYKPPKEWVRRFARDPDRAERLLDVDQRRLFWRHNAGVEPLSNADLQAWRDLYAAEVAYQDYHMGQLLNWLETTGRLDDTCVIVVADHGENLGEHGLLNHQYCLYDTLLRVPLVIRYPARLSAGERVRHQVQTLDLFATILEIAGAPVPHNTSKSLLPGSQPRPYVVAEYGTPSPPRADMLEEFGLTADDLKRFERGLTAIRSDTHKLIVGTDGSRELYNWRDDPAEEQNRIEQEPAVAETLHAQLEEWWAEHDSHLIGQADETASVNPEVQARLQALGYME